MTALGQEQSPKLYHLNVCFQAYTSRSSKFAWGSAFGHKQPFEMSATHPIGTWF